MYRIFYENQKGITLIELMIGISIMVVLLALAIPSLKGRKLNEATRTIFSDLRYARMQAIKSRNSIMVTFDPNAFTYQVYNQDANQSILTKDIDNDFHGITFSQSNNPVFNPAGSVSPSGTVTVSDGINVKNITFSGTGRIRIQ